MNHVENGGPMFSGFVILVCGLALFSVAHLFTTLLIARLLGLSVQNVRLGLFWFPLRFNWAGTSCQVGPLMLASSVDFSSRDDEAPSQWEQAGPLTRAGVAVFGPVLVLGVGWLWLGQPALGSAKAALQAYVLLPFSSGTALSPGALTESLAAPNQPSGAVLQVMVALAALHLVPLPPFPGFAALNACVVVLRGRPIAERSTLILLKLNLAWLLLLAAMLMFRQMI